MNCRFYIFVSAGSNYLLLSPLCICVSTGTFTHALRVVAPELSMGQFCVTRSNPTHQLTDPTQPNPL